MASSLALQSSTNWAMKVHTLGAVKLPIFYYSVVVVVWLISYLLLLFACFSIKLTFTFVPLVWDISGFTLAIKPFSVLCTLTFWRADTSIPFTKFFHYEHIQKLDLISVLFNMSWWYCRLGKHGIIALFIVCFSVVSSTGRYHLLRTLPTFWYH